MSTFSTIGAAVVGGVTALAGIVSYEMRPTPPSAVAVCERFIPAGDGLETGIGCRQDGRPIQVIGAIPTDPQVP